MPSHISPFDIGSFDNYHEEMVKPPDDEQRRGSSQDIDRLGYLSARVSFNLNSTKESAKLVYFFSAPLFGDSRIN